jgi:acetyl-CoA carboxylase carboxyltransferase component
MLPVSTGSCYIASRRTESEVKNERTRYHHIVSPVHPEHDPHQHARGQHPALGRLEALLCPGQAVLGYIGKLASQGENNVGKIINREST